MGYEKQTWIAYQTPVGAARLNHMEEGIAALSEGNAKQASITAIVREMLNAAVYAKDVSALKAQLDAIIGGGSGDDPGDTPPSPSFYYLDYDVLYGTVLQNTTYIKYDADNPGKTRATLNPFAFYTEAGKRYSFSLGGVSGMYFAVAGYEVADDNLSFAIPDTTQDYAHSVNCAKTLDSGWLKVDHSIESNDTYNVFAVTFKRTDNGDITADDLAALQTNFTIKVEEVSA